ncbi:Lysosome-associated membrane glycoprotein 3 [Platysternon megacephalum]|uniref:Lysosome-associated membrane glycoprotein 3 n=1 Tax=Platysternon megacephalum TaxID=55544 RepID=A0A4D9DQ36_9SAUR|nr:Lysosome-associated membrane glycoprotein 3 [Platysternon megacephalum]
MKHLAENTSPYSCFHFPAIINLFLCGGLTLRRHWLPPAPRPPLCSCDSVVSAQFEMYLPLGRAFVPYLSALQRGRAAPYPTTAASLDPASTMGRRALEVVLLHIACAFLSCHADVGNYEMELKSTPQSTSFLQRTTSAQSVSPYQITSSSHAVTTLFSSRTSNIITTSLSQRTSVHTATQTTNHHPLTSPTTASSPDMTTQARENSTQLTSKTTHLILTTTVAGKKTTAKPPLPTNETTTHVRVTTTAQTSNKTTIQRTEKTTLPTNQTTHSGVATTAAAKKTTAKPTSPTKQTTTLAETTTATTTATTKKAVKTTTQPTKQTTHTAAKTTARTNMTTLPPGNQTTRPATTATVGPTLAPDPSSPITGAYNVSNGSVNCIKASMGLGLIVQNSKTKKGYFNIDPSITQTSGSCGNLQSNLNLTFNGGFISFTFVKKDRVYYISTVEASLKIPSLGSWHNVTSQQRFTATMGNSFKCLSKQMVNLADNFQLLTVNTQLQAFAIVGDQFGKEEECSLDRNRRTIPIALGLSTLGLFVIVLAWGLISRRKPNRGYERI